MAIDTEGFRMGAAPTAQAEQPVQLQQAEYPPDILPIYVAKMSNVSHTPGNPDNYPPPPPPPSDTASGGEPIIPQPTDPPANVDVPAISQDGAVLNCTMGNWTNTPTTYAYAWQLDGTAAGADVSLTVTAGDVGKTATCIVTASNAAGSTAAPPAADFTVVALP